jgi:hypothetical protein
MIAYLMCTCTTPNHCPCWCVCVFVLFIGTWFSNLYTAVDTPHEPEPRYVHDVSVFVCKGVFGSCKASQPPNILAYTFPSTSAFSLRLMSLRLAVVGFCSFSACSWAARATACPHFQGLTNHFQRWSKDIFSLLL